MISSTRPARAEHRSISCAISRTRCRPSSSRRCSGCRPRTGQRVKALSDGLITFFPQQRNFDQLYELHEYWRALIADRRAAPRDDLISALITARDSGDVFSDDELIGQLTLLLVAGHETTTYALGSAVLHLLRQPGAWETLPEMPIEPAVEELLRYDAPFQALGRVAARTWNWVGCRSRPGITSSSGLAPRIAIRHAFPIRIASISPAPITGT